MDFPAALCIFLIKSSTSTGLAFLIGLLRQFGQSLSTTGSDRILPTVSMVDVLSSSNSKSGSTCQKYKILQMIYILHS